MSKTQITAEPGIPQIIITREFDAPRGLVYRAYIEPDLLRTVSAFQSVEDRDAMVASGMERGAHDSGDRLTELLARLQAT